MVGSLLSAANWPIVGQICWVLGKVMNFIYTMLDGALPSETGWYIYYPVYDSCIYPDAADDN